MIRTAILVDGAFYRKRAYHLFGDKSPAERAKELSSQPGTMSLIESTSYLSETTKERCYYLVNNYME